MALDFQREESLTDGSGYRFCEVHTPENDLGIFRAKLSDIRHRHDTQPALLAALQAMLDEIDGGCRMRSLPVQQAREAIKAATKG